MSTMYFSGIEKEATAAALLACNAAGMMSVLQYSPALLAACKDMRLVFDCGAYTRELTEEDIKRYVRLICLLKDRMIWYANADAIGNQKRSNENYQLLLSLLPPSLHDRILWIYQQSADIEHLYEGLRSGHKRIGIGGLVPILQEDQYKAKGKILMIAEIIRQYDCVPHFFGLGTYGIIQALHNYLADFTVDHTTWLNGGKYGVAINSRGQQKPANADGFEYDAESILKSNIRVMSRWIERPSWETRPPVKKTRRNKYVQLDFTEIGA